MVFSGVVKDLVSIPVVIILLKTTLTAEKALKDS